MHAIRAEITKRLPTGRQARRLFHGRGHCFAGYSDLVIDSYPPVVLVTLYRPRPPFWIRQLVTLLCELMPEQLDAILLQERHTRPPTIRRLYGRLPEVPVAYEDDLLYLLRFDGAQNIGFFPDMAAGRTLVRRQSAGKRVLNLFAYSCSFSVAALAGGAQQVVNLDMNKGALQLGRENHRLNNLDLRRASFLAMELFRSMGRLRRLGPFDLIICDPPASQGRSFTAERHWPKLVGKLPGLLRNGGDILACLNAPHLAPDYLDELFHDRWPQARLVQSASPGPDFPEAMPERGVSLHHYRVD